MDEKPRRVRFRFGLRTLFEIIAVLAVVLTLMFYRLPTVRNVGRYQFHDVSGRIYVIDTETGRVWQREPAGPTSGPRWFEENVPTE